MFLSDFNDLTFPSQRNDSTVLLGDFAADVTCEDPTADSSQVKPPPSVKSLSHVPAKPAKQTHTHEYDRQRTSRRAVTLVDFFDTAALFSRVASYKRLSQSSA